MRMIEETKREVGEIKKRISKINYFVAMTVHEFKTPLAKAKVLSQLAKRKLVKKDYDDLELYLNKITGKVDALTYVVNNFLNMVKISAGELKAVPEVFDLDSFIRELAADLRALVTDHKIIIWGGLKRNIYIDKTLLKEIITNLVANASKYSGNNKNIVINIEPFSKYFTIRVQDYGTGIDKKYFKQIFQPFNHAPAVSAHSGLGIGLYLSLQLSRMMDGDITVKSTINEGSKFSVKLPYDLRRDSRKPSKSFQG